MKNCKALSYIARNIRLVSGKFVMTTNSRAITSPGVSGLSVKHHLPECEASARLYALEGPFPNTSGKSLLISSIEKKKKKKKKNQKKRKEKDKKGFFSHKDSGFQLQMIFEKQRSRIKRHGFVQHLQARFSHMNASMANGAYKTCSCQALF